MTARLPSGMLVAALVRRVNDAGGIAVVLARGDAESGAIMLLLEDEARVLERGYDLDGRPTLFASRPSAASGESIDDYWARRRSRDPDLWIVALHGSNSERFAAETILAV